MRKVLIPGFGHVNVGGNGSTYPAVGLIPSTAVRAQFVTTSPFSDSPVVLELELAPEHALELATALRLEALRVMAPAEAYTCHRQVEAEAFDDGWTTQRCGAPAAMLDTDLDVGYCADHEPPLGTPGIVPLGR